MGVLDGQYEAFEAVNEELELGSLMWGYVVRTGDEVVEAFGDGAGFGLQCGIHF